MLDKVAESFGLTRYDPNRLKRDKYAGWVHVDNVVSCWEDSEALLVVRIFENQYVSVLVFKKIDSLYGTYRWDHSGYKNTPVVRHWEINVDLSLKHDSCAVEHIPMDGHETYSLRVDDLMKYLTWQHKYTLISAELAKEIKRVQTVGV